MNKEFIKAFTGLQRDFGIADLEKTEIDPSTGKVKPIYAWLGRPLTENDYLSHLNGKKSIGIQPCDDQGMARFGAIDIDDKQHSYKNFPFKKYLDIIAKYKLPLVPVKSKSGGLHLYVFLKEPAKAVFVRNFLEKLLFSLKLPTNIEIYPKQTELGKDSDGKFVNGQFINLPYYNKTERRGFNLDGTQFSFEEFIKIIEANTFTSDELEEFSISHVQEILKGGGEEFKDGPPCLQSLTIDKLTDGRDRFLYNYMVFAKKKYPDNWEEMVRAAPGKYFQPDANGVVDWTEDKTKKKINSWKKETKGHKCNEDPIVNFCMKSVCRTRQFGYLSDKKKVFPALTGLQKITYKEPEYTFNVTLPDGETTKEVRAKNIKQIIILDELRAIIGNAAGIIPPKIKQNEFQDVLDLLFPPKMITPPPKGTSEEELLEEYLLEYLRGPKAENYSAFKSGATLIDGDKAFFVYKKFFNVLKNKEWKEKPDKTAEIMQKKFKAEFQVKKRFPKKLDSDKENPIVSCTSVPVNISDLTIADPELVVGNDTKEIF
jgi:hypothetical protein